MKTTPKDASRAMWKVGCSGALYSTLNKEFGNSDKVLEEASAVLSGGINQQGEQCGMLWGSAMATGAEAFRKIRSTGESIKIAVSTSKKLMASYANRTNCTNCCDFSRADFTKPLHLVKYMLFRAPACFRLAKAWMPEAYESAQKGLSEKAQSNGKSIVSCATVVAKRLGASDVQAHTVAGFAGGMGLSGQGCGALAAAIWVKAINELQAGKIKNVYKHPAIKKTIDDFKVETNNEMTCKKICGRMFKDIEDHTEFIGNGGCFKIIDSLVKS